MNELHTFGAGQMVNRLILFVNQYSNDSTSANKKLSTIGRHKTKPARPLVKQASIHMCISRHTQHIHILCVQHSKQINKII